MANQTIIGVIKRTSEKTGKTSYTYYFQEPFSEYETRSSDSASGFKTGSEFSYTEFNVKPGDVCAFSYSKGFQDRAVLDGITVVKPAAAK